MCTTLLFDKCDINFCPIFDSYLIFDFLQTNTVNVVVLSAVHTTSLLLTPRHFTYSHCTTFYCIKQYSCVTVNRSMFHHEIESHLGILCIHVPHGNYCIHRLSRCRMSHLSFSNLEKTFCLRCANHQHWGTF